MLRPLGAPRWAAGLALLGLGACAPEVTRPPTDPLVQIWLPTGVTLSRSPALGGQDLPHVLATGGEEPEAEWIEVAGRPARAVGRRLLVPTPLGPQLLQVVVARETTDHRLALRSLGGLLVGAWLLGSVGLAGVLFLVVRRGLSPLDRLGRDLDRLGARNLDAALDLPGAPSELRPVVDQLNAMLRRLRDAFEQEHMFSAHAAHELRTPLAGLRMTLELALSRERSTEEHVHAAERSLSVALELQRTVEALLELARAVDGPLPDQATVDVTGELERAWSLRAARAAERTLAFERHPQGPVEVMVAAGLLERVLDNLVDNAIEHAPEGATIRGRVRCGRGRLSVVLANPAPQLTPEEARRTLDAFWRADPSRHGTGRHSGLGMALGRRIAERLEGTLQVRVAGGWFYARLNLPA